MSKTNLFITGSSGAIGRYLLGNSIKEDYDSVFILMRSRSDKFDGIRAFLKKEGLKDQQLKKIKIMNGDITQDFLGLTTKQYKDLAKKTTHILHCAANTNFSLELETARAINVGGTKQIINLAKSCDSIKAFGYLSTVYVSGKREGIIMENDLVNTGFINSYEQSKFETEKLLREQTEIPVSVYRLSTIVGDSRSGFVPGFNSVHKALRLYFEGLAPMVPGLPSNPAELLDVFYATEAVNYLFNKNFVSGKTYHIVSGKNYSYTLEDFINETGKFFNKHSSTWRNKGIEKPPIVNMETFQLFEKSVIEANDKVMLGIIKIMNYFVPHLSLTTEYDTSNTDKDLGKVVKRKHVQDYYSDVINYCINSKWGKIAYETRTI